MKLARLLLRAAAHGLIGITLGLATWLVADSLPLALRVPATSPPCPCTSPLNPGETP